MCLSSLGRQKLRRRRHGSPDIPQSGKRLRVRFASERGLFWRHPIERVLNIWTVFFVHIYLSKGPVHFSHNPFTDLVKDVNERRGIYAG